STGSSERINGIADREPVAKVLILHLCRELCRSLRQKCPIRQRLRQRLPTKFQLRSLLQQPRSSSSRGDEAHFFRKKEFHGGRPRRMFGRCVLPVVSRAEWIQETW